MLDAEARSALPRLGFFHRKRRFRLQLADGVEGRVGLNRANMAPGTVSVQPFVSVHHERIERELARRLGDDVTDDATISAHLGEVGGREKYPDLIVSDSETAREVVEYVMDRLMRYGIPWMDAMVPLPGLAAGLERFLAGEPQFRRPIAYREIGRIDLAIDSIDRTLRWYGDAPNRGTAERFRDFAHTLRQELVAILPDTQVESVRRSSPPTG